MSQQSDTPVETLAERAHRILRDRLVMLEIGPGDPLRDEQIGIELGVGRTPVREALKRLEGERLVVSYPRQGTFASEVNLQDVRRLGEVRRQLEPLGAQLAAERATEEQRNHLLQLRGTSVAAGRGKKPSKRNENLILTDLALHRAMYETVHNPYLEDTLNYYSNLATRIWCVLLPQLPEMTSHVAEHDAIIGAVVDGNVSLAGDLVRSHVEHFETVVRGLL